MNKNNEKVNEPLLAESVRGIKGVDDRSMKQHPVYIKAWIGRKDAVCLVDSGSEKCVITRKLINEATMEPARCRLFAANSTTVNVIGEIVLNVHLGDLTIPTRFVVSDSVTEPMLGVNWLRRNKIVWDFAKDLLIINREVFNMVPESDEQANYRRMLLKKQEIEMKISKKRDGGELEKACDVKRHKISSKLPARIIIMIQALPLEKIEPDQDHSECIRIEDVGREETDVTVDILCTIEPVIDGDILFNCNFSAAKGKEMDIEDGTYSCFICQDFDPHFFNRARDLIRHSVSKHKQYPNKAKHNKPYPVDGSDLRPAKADEILQCGDRSHHKKGMTDQQWEEIKRNTRTKASEKKKKVEALKEAKKQEEEEEEVTLNLNRALMEVQEKRKTLQIKEKERKNVTHATDDAPKKPVRKMKSEVVKIPVRNCRKR